MRLIPLLILVLLPFVSFNQEVVFSEKIRLNYELRDLREAYSIIDSANKTTAYFLLDNTKINGYLLDDQFNITRKISSERNKDYKNIVGYTIKNNQYNLYFTDNKTKQIYATSINFKEDKVENSLLNYELKKERVLEKFSVDNKFYILTVKTLSKKLFLYVFDSNNLVSRKEIDLSNHIFNNDDDNLSLLLTKTSGSSNYVSNMASIDPSTPVSLEIASLKNKLYFDKETLTLTLDHRPKETIIIKINLTDYSYKLQRIPKGKPTENSCDNIKTSSYLHSNNLLFQIIGCKNELYFSIFDLILDSTLYEYRVNKTEEITINNTPVLQKKAMGFIQKDKFKEIEKTSRILRRISEIGIGISIFQLEDVLKLTIGSGVSNYDGINVSAYSFGFGLPTSFTPNFSKLPGVITYDPVYSNYLFNFNSNKNSEAGNIYFNSLFDAKNLTHIKGDIPENAYDRLLDFSENIKDPIAIETIFRKNQTYFFGYYHLNEHVYYLVKFDENK